MSEQTNLTRMREREAKLAVETFLGIKLETALVVGEGDSSTSSSKGSGSSWNLHYHPAYPLRPQSPEILA